MDSSSNPTKVLTIGDPGPTQQQITTALSSSAQTEFKLVDVMNYVDNLVRDIRSANPQIIMVDHKIGEHSVLDIIDEVTMQFPEVAVVSILESEDPLEAQQVMLAGAQAFLVKPFTQVNLLSTLRRVRELRGRRVTKKAPVTDAADQMRPLRMLSVYSPRGGAGCTTLAVNVAVKLHEMSQKRTLLVGGKLFFGHLGLMLNIRTNNTIADLVPHASNLDEGLIYDVINEHVSGINVLLGPFDFQVAQGIRPDDIYSILTGLKRHFELIVVDVGSSLSENAVTCMDVSDRVLLVTNPDLASLQDASRFIQLSRSMAIPDDKLLFVLNKSGLKGGVRDEDIESALHRELFAEIPHDSASVLRSLNRGVPVVRKYSRSPASKAIIKMTRKLDDLNVVGQPAGGQSKSAAIAGGNATQPASVQR